MNAQTGVLQFLHMTEAANGGGQGIQAEEGRDQPGTLPDRWHAFAILGAIARSMPWRVGGWFIVGVTEAGTAIKLRGVLAAKPYRWMHACVYV